MSLSLLRTIIDVLDRHGVDHMLSGSYASNEYGELRTTQDIDVVIDPAEAALRAMLDELDRDHYYVDRDAAIVELHRRGMFNVIELGTGWKIDMIIRKQRPFSVAEFERRIRSTAFGFPVWIATAEDVILSKLEWAKRGGSERQVDDAKAIVRVRRDDLDTEYMRRWAGPLGIEDLVDNALA